MKLIKCYISSFSKISNYTFDFNDGFNEIKQDNGWGKSTLATFIRVMFYGIENGGKGISNNLRKKYKPWKLDGSFGGYIVFETRGKVFKIERYFGSKSSEDSVKLIDMESGKESPKTEDLGRRIFDIDEEGFLYTTYFSQDNLESKSNSTLTKKYNSICDAEGEQNLDKILDNLLKKSREYSTTGNRGKIPQLKSDIKEIEGKILYSESSKKTLDALNQEIIDLENEISILEQKEKSINEELLIAGKIEGLKFKKERFDKLTLNANEIKVAINENCKILNGSCVSLEQIENLEKCVVDLRTNETKSETLKEVYNSQQNNSENSANSKQFNSKILMYILAGILLVCGGISFAFNLILGSVLVGLALVIFILTFAIKGGEKNSNNNLSNSSIKAEIDGYESIILEYKNQIERTISQFNFEQGYSSYEDALSTIKNCILSVKKLENDLNKINNELETLSKEKEIFDENIQNVDLNKLKLDLQDVQLQLKSKTENLSRAKSSYTHNEDIVDRLVDLRAEKEQKENLLRYYQEDKSIVDYTRQFLSDANENLKINYRKPLMEKLNKYYSCLLEDGKNIEIDIDFNVTVEEKEGLKETDYYSKGLKDLLEICKRFALIDVLFDKEKPFIILDDPFANFDENKIEKSLNLLGKLAEEHQIIYLVCHNSRSREKYEI